MNKLLACLGLVTAVALSGCTLYFGDEHHGDNCPAGTFPAENEWGEETCIAGGGDGYYCSTDNQCAAGCYCDENVGTCTEAGYCASDAECGYGMECDCSSSCVPVGTATRECGSSCFEVPCPDGLVCSADGTCVAQPPGCTDDTQCAAGCFCLNGSCEETAICSTDADCPADQHCDATRSTCVPGAPPPVSHPSCAGEITCNIVPPTCAPGTTPLIQDGCYTGQCADVLLGCDAAPVCGNLNTESLCLARADCGAVYFGTNCTNPSTGASCTMGQSGCTCENFTFDHCGTL